MTTDEHFSSAVKHFSDASQLLTPSADTTVTTSLSFALRGLVHLAQALHEYQQATAERLDEIEKALRTR